jgi:hypothetical protein
MKKTHVSFAALAAAAISASALADLTGTSMNLNLTTNGLAGTLAGPSGGSYTYGSSGTFNLLTAPTSWDASSPAFHPLYDNSILLDFADFQYASYAVLGPASSTLNVTGLAEDAADGSIGVYLITDLFTNIAQTTSSSGDAFSVKWDVSTVATNPLGPAAIVAWNSVPVPAPGPLALVGAAAALTSRRRRLH